MCGLNICVGAVTLSPVLQDVLHALHCHLQHFSILQLRLQLQQSTQTQPEGKAPGDAETLKTTWSLLFMWHTHSCRCSLTSVSAMKSRSSCKLLLIRALRFFSTSGFLACRGNSGVTLPSQSMGELLEFGPHKPPHLSVGFGTVSSVRAVGVDAHRGHVDAVCGVGVVGERETLRRSVDDPEEPLQTVHGTDGPATDQACGETGLLHSSRGSSAGAYKASFTCE